MEPTPGTPYAGRAVGEFVLGEKLGQGAFGAVHAAAQRGLGREAAVKVLRPSLAITRDATQRFLREAQLASRLDHPYAAHVYAFGAEPDGLLWIAMERVRGTTLSELIRTSGALAIDRFFPLFERICEVVQTAHDQGIIHRDLKPSNVMVVSRAGRLLPKLLDFGIARSFGLASSESAEVVALAPTSVVDSAITRHGQLLGSPAYMAPEQWSTDGDVGPWSDQYALAVLAYEALAGTAPFRARTMAELGNQHLAHPWPRLSAPLSAAASDVLARAAAKRPADRFPTVTAFAAALREAAGFSPESPEGVPALPEPLRDAWISDGPQPIAEAIALLSRARSASLALESLGAVAGLLAHWLGLLALASRSKQVHAADESAMELVRELRRRVLRDDEWLPLARALVRPFATRPEAAPLPELARFLIGAEADALDRLVRDRERRLAAGTSEAEARLAVAEPMAELARVLDALGWLCDYALARSVDGGFELWMGTAHDDRVRCARHSQAPLASGAIVLLDPDGGEVLLASPLIQVALPAGGEREVLFVFAGPSRGGAARLVAARGYERDDASVWEWLRAGVLDDAGIHRAGLDDEGSPWRGLAPWRAEDAQRFVGREREIEEMLDRLHAQPLVAVIGPSGVGKSSFLDAGVIPGLPNGWVAIAIRPGRAPIRALVAALGAGGRGGPYRDATTIDTEGLADALASRPEALGERLRAAAERDRTVFVLVVDQVEELFTLGGDDVERDRFVAALAASCASIEAPVRVVLTMRDDFLCRAEALRPLRGRLGRGLQLLATPTASDLERILTVPASRSGYAFDDPKLPAEMVAAVRDLPGALPLLSFTAARLFELRDRHFKRLTRAGYIEIGGVTGALVGHAEAALERMPAADRALVRRAFSRLVTAEGTRATVGRAELAAALGDKGDEILDRLIASRLVVSSEQDGGERVEVIHETLLTAWPRLVTWRREDVEGARFREQLAAAARQWAERSRPRGLLWRGEAVAELRRVVKDDEPLTPTERAFATSSLADERRGRRRVISGLVALCAVLAVGVALLARANGRISDGRERAVRQLATNLEDHGRQALLAHDPAVALLYLAEAAKLGAAGPAHELLVGSATKSVEASVGGLATPDQPQRAIVASADHRVVAVPGADRTTRLFDGRTGGLVATLAGHDAAVFAAAISNDGELVVTTTELGGVGVWRRDGRLIWRQARAHRDIATVVDLHAGGGVVLSAGLDQKLRLYALADGASRGEIELPGPALAARFAPDGKHVAVGLVTGELRIYAVDGLAVVGSGKAGDDSVLAVAFSPDGTTIATGSDDHIVRLWDGSTAAPRRVLVGHAQSVTAVEFSADGTRLASAGRDGIARIWDPATGVLIAAVGDTGAAIHAVHFSLDGTRIVTAGADQTVRVWDAFGTPIATLAGHAGTVAGAVFDPSGTRVESAGWDGAVKTWDLARATAAIPLGHGGRLVEARFSPDGRWVATASDEGRVALWTMNGRRAVVLDAEHRTATAIDVDPSGKRVAIAGEDGALSIWATETGTLARRIAAGKSLAWVRFAPDGASIVTAEPDGQLAVWDAATGARRATARVDTTIGRFDLSPRGDRLVTGADKAILLSLPDLAMVAELVPGPAKVLFHAFSPDGATIAVASGRTASVFDATTGARRLVLPSHGGFVNATRFSPDGRALLTASEDRFARLWELPSGRLIATLSHGDAIMDADWSPDGTLVATAGVDGTARVWDVATAKPILGLAGHGNPVYGATFSPDGARLVTFDSGGSAIVHDVHRDHRDADALDALARCRVPYRLIDGVVTPAEPDPSACW